VAAWQHALIEDDAVLTKRFHYPQGVLQGRGQIVACINQQNFLGKVASAVGSADSGALCAEVGIVIDRTGASPESSNKGQPVVSLPFLASIGVGNYRTIDLLYPA
jgi:hypothetical protein